MARYAVLLRGINLGPKRRLGMAELRSAFEAAGYGDVETLAQSGNVVLTSARGPARLERELAETLREAFGFEVAVLARTRSQLADVVAGDPFGDDADDPSRYQVSFLSAAPAPARVAALERAAVAPERVAVRGREVYAWHPGGVGRSALAKSITARALGVEVTARNWRTVTRLLELADRA